MYVSNEMLEVLNYAQRPAVNSPLKRGGAWNDTTNKCEEEGLIVNTPNGFRLTPFGQFILDVLLDEQVYLFIGDVTFEIVLVDEAAL